MFLFFVLYHLLLSGNFYGSGIRHGILWGLNFDPGIFGGYIWSPKDFLGVYFCPHWNIPVTWNPEYPPPPGWPAWHFSLQYQCFKKTELSWELSTWSGKMSLIDISTNSPHHFYWKSIGTVNEIYTYWEILTKKLCRRFSYAN